MKKLLIAVSVVAISTGAFAAENNAFYLGAEAGYTRIEDTTQQGTLGYFYCYKSGLYDINALIKISFDKDMMKKTKNK